MLSALLLAVQSSQGPDPPSCPPTTPRGPASFPAGAGRLDRWGIACIRTLRLSCLWRSAHVSSPQTHVLINCPLALLEAAVHVRGLPAYHAAATVIAQSVLYRSDAAVYACTSSSACCDSDAAVPPVRTLSGKAARKEQVWDAGPCRAQQAVQQSFSSLRMVIL